MNTKSLAVLLFVAMFFSTIMQPFLTANSLEDKNNQKVEEGFELIYDNTTYSIIYPLEKSVMYSQP
ncbi:MAG: hypothetical protein QMC80_06885 [Thermoplasmatales archaeon]|nr:hypothetical protein [Thermoplasmatales archaeon]